MKIRARRIRSIVMQLLDEHGIYAAPVPVDQLARERGLFVTESPADDDLCGFILREGNGRIVIGVNGKHHRNRQRFTIAHELGHLLLHVQENVHVDRSNSQLQIRLRNTGGAISSDAEEKEANLFAAELLMPEEFLERDLAQYDVLDFLVEDERAGTLRNLARDYEVSVQALTYRLIDLGYVHSGMRF